MRPHIRNAIGAAIVAVIAMALPAGAATHAGTPVTHGTSGSTGTGLGYASFGDTTINLQQGWGSATACAAYADGTTDCFTSVAAMNASIAANTGVSVGATSAAAKAKARRAFLQKHTLRAATACQGNSGEWLYLYQNQNYGGQTLAIQDEDTTYNLADYGFSDEISSWNSYMACTAWGYKNTNFTGSSYTMTGWGESSYVGASWNDAIKAIATGD